MRVKMVYFAWVRERIGRGEEMIDAPDDLRTVAELVDWLATQSAEHAHGFAERDRLRAALDQRFVPLDAELGSAREVAIFPPVTGG